MRVVVHSAVIQDRDGTGLVLDKMRKRFPWLELIWADGGYASADGNIVRLPPVLFQPIAADDIAPIVAEVALAAPRGGILEIAGPERAPFNEIVALYLKAVGDPREVVRDPEARYFGGRVEELSLVPLGEARLGRIGLDEWLRRSQARA